MHPAELREHLRKRPFQSFRIVLANGKWFDIRSSEGIVVTTVETAVVEHDEIRTFGNSQILEIVPLSGIERVSPELS